jgi:hypothetical protein
LKVGRKADDLAPSKHYCCEIQRSENRTRYAEFTEEGCGSKSAVLPVIIIIIVRERERPFRNLRAEWVLGKTTEISSQKTSSGIHPADGADWCRCNAASSREPKTRSLDLRGTKLGFHSAALMLGKFQEDKNGRVYFRSVLVCSKCVLCDFAYRTGLYADLLLIQMYCCKLNYTRDMRLHVRINYFSFYFVYHTVKNASNKNYRLLIFHNTSCFQEKKFVGFEILTAVVMKSSVV